MKKNLRHWAGAAVGVAAALAFTSCVYDPYALSVGGGYDSGYGEGYGYGNSHFSSSVFVSTGDPRWGYDASCYSYYDYQRRCYYDPYLNGYYPIGYRPPIIIGTPHPYGWRPGHGFCPPPRYVNHLTLTNYHNRESAYRNSNFEWSKQIRRAPERPRVMNHSSVERARYSTPQVRSEPSGNHFRTFDGQSSSSVYARGVSPAARESRHNPQFQNTIRQSTLPHAQSVTRGGSSLQPSGHARTPTLKSKNDPRSSKDEKHKGLRGLGNG